MRVWWLWHILSLEPPSSLSDISSAIFVGLGRPGMLQLRILRRWKIWEGARLGCKIGPFLNPFLWGYTRSITPGIYARPPMVPPSTRSSVPRHRTKLYKSKVAILPPTSVIPPIGPRAIRASTRARISCSWKVSCPKPKP